MKYYAYEDINKMADELIDQLNHLKTSLKKNVRNVSDDDFFSMMEERRLIEDSPPLVWGGFYSL